MNRTQRTLVVLIAVCAPSILFAQPQTAASVPAGGTCGIAPTPTDTRRLVDLPPAAQETLRDDMLQHMITLSRVLSALAKGRHEIAAQVAENQLGMSAMGKRADTPEAAPGRYMPPEMREMGLKMHEAASGLAQAARKADHAQTYAKLKSVMTACAACHYAYRTH